MMNDMSTDVTSSKALSTHRSRGVPNCPSLYEADLVLNVKEALPQSHRQEYSIKCRLDDLMRSQGTLYHGLGNMDVLRAHLSSNAVPLRSVSGNMVSDAASIAKRISEAVKRLDLEQDRVKKTLWVVEQVVELKACVLGVTGCMGAPQDWEAAAIYLNRASKIITEIVNGKFAEVLVPTAEVPDPPKLTLEKASDSLCGLFLREFEKAAREGNGTKITRFFKLFPLIGKSDVGLDVYGRYVCQGVASRARASLNMGTGAAERKERLFYANALIQLFEHIAQIVMHHSRLVEGHYGVGRMVKVIERLQLEADIQGGILIDTWSDERNIDLRLTDIRSYAFTFLVQSFLPGPPARSNIPRTSSPAKENTNAERNAQEDNPVDLKEIDGVLNEIALMLGRWSVYSNFIAANCMVRKDTLQSLKQKI